MHTGIAHRRILRSGDITIVKSLAPPCEPVCNEDASMQPADVFCRSDAWETGRTASVNFRSSIGGPVSLNRAPLLSVCQSDDARDA